MVKMLLFLFMILCITYVAEPLILKDGKNITCFCNNEDWNGHSQRQCKDNRCISRSRFTVCYTSLTNEKGCTFFTTCQNHNHDKTKPPVECCWESMCNQFVNGSEILHPTRSPATTKASSSPKMSKNVIALIVAIPLSVVIVVLTIVLMYKYLRKPNYAANFLRPLRTGEPFLPDLNILASTGSGSGLPLLSKQTIVNQIYLKECVNKGKFGTVYRGVWHDVDVAVKVFSTGEEISWFCETEIYQTNMLRHENILGFIAADSKDTGVCTEYWLVCEYHPKGSLFNYLQTEVLDAYNMLKMLLSVANGLNHLHMLIIGNQAKPPIAHRDIKTKNILVKSDDTCCIADLGLAVTKTSVTEGAVNSYRTGTQRYHAPELLNHTMDSAHFDSYLKADIYALGLCMWEVCWRTKLDGHSTPEYALPYFDQVPGNPCDTDMLQVVCIDQQRPQFSQHWEECAVMKSMMKLMDECWCSEASARLPILRIRKNLISLCRFHDIPV